MTMVAIPTGRASEMPVAAAAKGASTVMGKAVDTPAEGQFAAVLQQRTQVPGKAATARNADAADRPDTGKRADGRGQSRKDEAKVGAGEGVGQARAGIMAPMVVISAPGNLALADSATVLLDSAEGGLEVSAATDPKVEVDPQMAAGTDVSTAGNVCGETTGASGRESAVAEVGSGDGAEGGMAAGAKAAPAADGSSGAGSSVSRNAASGLPLQAATGDHAALPQELPAGAGMAAGAVTASDSATEAVGAAASAGGAAAKQQGSVTKGSQGKVSGMERHPVIGNMGLRRAQGEFAAVGAAGSQAGLPGENGSGQNEGKGEGRLAGKPNGEVAETGARDGAAADGRSSGPSQPVLVSAAEVQAGAAVMLPIAAVPVEAPHALAASDRGSASGSGEAAGSGPAWVGSGGANAGSGVIEAAPLTSVGAARLLKTMAGSELRVGTQSADLGAVTIRTVLGREQMQAHISFENERMGSALSAHLLGGSLEDRLGRSLGLRTSVTLSAGTDAGTGQSGRETARETLTGQSGNQSGSQTGSGNGGGRDGSGRHTAEAALGGLGSHGRNGAG